VGFDKRAAIVGSAALVGYLVIAGGYGRVERVFLAMTLVFFAYPVAAILAHPDWAAVARGAFVPSLRPDAEDLTTLPGLVTPSVRALLGAQLLGRLGVQLGGAAGG